MSSLKRIFGLLVLLGSAAGLGYWLLHDDNVDSNRPLQVIIGTANLAVPRALVPFADMRRDGVSDHLDLAFTFPDFAPLQLDRRVLAGASEKNVNAHALFLVLTPADAAVAPADRVVMLYTRFLGSDTTHEDYGLEMRHFELNSPYGGEDLYYAPPEGRAFAARCPVSNPAAKAVETSLSESCIAEFRTKSLDVQMRFLPILLPQWRVMTEKVQDIVGKMIK